MLQLFPDPLLDCVDRLLINWLVFLSLVVVVVISLVFLLWTLRVLVILVVFIDGLRVELLVQGGVVSGELRLLLYHFIVETAVACLLLLAALLKHTLDHCSFFV